MSAQHDLSASIVSTLQLGTAYTDEQLTWLTPSRVRALETQLNLTLTGNVDQLFTNYGLTYLTARTPPEFQFDAAVRSGDKQRFLQLLTPERMSDLIIDDYEYAHLCYLAANYKAYFMIQVILAVVRHAMFATMGQNGLDDFNDFKPIIIDNVTCIAVKQGNWRMVKHLLGQGADINDVFRSALYAKRTDMALQMITHLEAYAPEHNLSCPSNQELFKESLQAGTLYELYHSRGGSDGIEPKEIAHLAISSGNIKAVDWVTETFGYKPTAEDFLAVSDHDLSIPFLEHIKAQFGSDILTEYININIRSIYLANDLDLIDYAHNHGYTDWNRFMIYPETFVPRNICLKAHFEKLMENIMVDVTP